LMMSTNNILSPANGKPIIVPTQDIVLGLYYLSLALESEPGEGMVFADLDEVLQALDAGVVSLHSRISCRVFEPSGNGATNGEMATRRVETTPGRMLLFEILPTHPAISFDRLLNQLLTKREITQVVDEVYRHCGQKETVVFADRLMNLGFSYAAKAGISFGKDDMVVPASKADLVNQTRELVKQYEQQYADGLITKGEKYNKVVDAWAQCTDRVADEMMVEIRGTARVRDAASGRLNQPNSIYMMADSGARGSAAQIKQLAGMRGLMAKPSGEIIETPIISNFKEGLTVLEYFNSTHGARKGLADTALKTANSGYLTRRLVDVAQDCIIVEEDCGTENAITLSSVIQGGEVIEELAERILGRTTAEDVAHPQTGEVLVPAHTLLDEETVRILDEAVVESVRVRSVLTCESQVGVCSMCYGRDLARGTPVNVGEAVGVIAAQSIGEPGTQLTMRTFHIGGAAQSQAERSSVEATISGTMQLVHANLVTDSKGRQVVLGRTTELVLHDETGREKARHRLPYGARLLVEPNATVEK
ncbi:MAG: DNA-directed RNA polymerase subunit beta', partial [Geminicoccaceae bacterium]